MFVFLFVLFFFYPQGSQTYYFAHGETSNSYGLAYHGVTKEQVAVNLEAGTAEELIEDEFTTDEHCLFMTLSFGVLLPLGALVNRFLGYSLCAGIKFFRNNAYLSNQLHRTMMIIAWVLAMLGFITQWAHLGEIHFEQTHNVLGLIGLIQLTLLVFGVLYSQLKLGYIQPIATGKGDTKMTNGHRIFGVIFIIYGLFVIMTGEVVAYGRDSQEFTLFLTYVLILLAVYLIFEIYGCVKKDSMDKTLVLSTHENTQEEKLPIVFDPDRAQMVPSSSTQTTGNASAGGKFLEVETRGGVSQEPQYGTAMVSTASNTAEINAVL